MSCWHATRRDWLAQPIVISWWSGVIETSREILLGLGTWHIWARDVVQGTLVIAP